MMANKTARAFTSSDSHSLRSLLIGTTILLTLAGFSTVYFGAGADANPYHHLHLATTLLWLALLLCQHSLIRTRNYSSHRKIGLLVIGAAPLLVGSAALLSVESAREGVASGQGDFMIVQNVMGTLELGLIIVLAFALRGRRELHASFLMGSALLFMGIALFFTLIGFVPGFRIEGPETFYRFAKALTTIQYTSLAIGLLFWVKSRRDGWPLLLVGSFPLLNELVKSSLARKELIQPLTEFVGSINQTVAFIGSCATVLLLLVATGVLNRAPKRVLSIQTDRP